MDRPTASSSTSASGPSVSASGNEADGAEPFDHETPRSKGKIKTSESASPVKTPQTADQPDTGMSELLNELRQLRNEQERLRWVLHKGLKVEDEEYDDRNLGAMSKSFLPLLDKYDAQTVEERTQTWFGLRGPDGLIDFRERVRNLRNPPSSSSVTVPLFELKALPEQLELVEKQWSRLIAHAENDDEMSLAPSNPLRNHVDNDDGISTASTNPWRNESFLAYYHDFDGTGIPHFFYNLDGFDRRAFSDVHDKLRNVVFGVTWDLGCFRSFRRIDKNYEGVFDIGAEIALLSALIRPIDYCDYGDLTKTMLVSDSQFFINMYCKRWRSLAVDSKCSMRNSSLVLQHHMRSFCCKEELPHAGMQQDQRDTRCERQAGKLDFLGNRGGTSFRERRFSFTLNCSLDSDIPGTYILVQAIDYEYTEEIPEAQRIRGWSQYNLFPCLPLFGITAFQLKLCHAISMWAGDWSAVLGGIGEALQVEINDVLKRDNREKLMYDNADLRRSEYYFTLLQLLRIFGDWIGQTLNDFDTLEAACKRLLEEDFVSRDDGTGSTPCYGQIDNKEQLENARKIVIGNWRTVRALQKDRGQSLLDQISQKTAEITSLRDGLFNAQSVREATKSSEVNRYLFVFTVATVIYLPASFVATFYGMDLYVSEDNMPRTRTVFWTVFCVVSGLTYVLALLGIFGVRRKDRLKFWFNKHFKDRAKRARPRGKTSIDKENP